MAKKSKPGVCQHCGGRGVLTGSFGLQVCSTCLKIRSNVNSHLPKIATAARDMGKGQELLAALVPDGGGLAIQVTADLLQDISGIVGYTGEDPGELVEAVRRRALACASCEAEDVLAEIREIVGYVPEQGDKGLADMVRQLVARPSVDCGKCTTLRGDLLRACGLEMDDAEDGEGWDVAAAAAIQEIAGLTNRKNFWIEEATELKAKVVELNELIGIGEAKLILAQQARDEWEQRAVQAEANVADQAAELNADDTRLRDELTRTGAELERLRDRAQESESRLIWYREALQVLRDRLGLDHLGEDEDVVERMLEAIASQAQAMTRFQEMARTADLRADEVEAELAQARSEIEGLRDKLAVAEAGAAQKLWEPEPAATVPTSTWGDERGPRPADRRVLRVEVAVQFNGIR